MAAIQPNLSNPLSELADIQLPHAVGIWPPAPGWWLLTVLMIIALYFLQRLFRSLWKTRCYRKALLTELQQVKRQWHKQDNVILTAAKLSALLRRYFMDQDKRQTVASLSQNNWFNYLHKKLQFGSNYKELLLELPYQDPLVKIDINEKEKFKKEINSLIDILNKQFKKTKRPGRI